ncbi:MAG: hypothetical protein H7Y28_05790 [Rhodoferax sp.]|nr:hypothetical protein [Rhodoferax sp.]
MKNFAAICADPSGLNPGMLSVDLALDCVFRSLPGRNALTYLNPKRAISVHGKKEGLQYHVLNSPDELERYDCVIYWGDFFHWLPYAHWDWLYENPLVQAGQTMAQLEDRWYSLFLLEQHAEQFRDRIVVFGGTFYGMTAQHLSDSRYQSALTSLYRAARLVAPRDSVSANLVPHLAPNHAYTLGCDCALLLDADATLPMDLAQKFVADTVPKKFITCFFGRSGMDAELLRFAEGVAQQLGVPLVVLDWLGQPEGLDGLAFKLAVIRRAAAVITDTYHLAVSAWREGVPVIGIGRAQSRATGTLDDKKKELFFRQILAADYYLYAEEIVAALANPAEMEKMLQSTAAILANTDSLKRVRKILSDQVVTARHKLIAALSAAT